MVRLQNRISVGLEVLQYFTTREWIFYNTNLLTMWGEMCPKDKEIFPIDFLAIDQIKYMKSCILGAREYCMKEKLSTLPKARRHQTMYVCKSDSTTCVHLRIKNFQCIFCNTDPILFTECTSYIQSPCIYSTLDCST